MHPPLPPMPRTRPRPLTIPSSLSLSSSSSLFLIVLLAFFAITTTAVPRTPNPEPVIWDINPKLVTTRGGTLLTIDGYNFGTNPAVAEIWLAALNSGQRGLPCPISGAYTDSRMFCTLPPGDGSPIFNLTVNGLIMRQLPRWPDDIYFWPQSTGSYAGPNCIATPNPNEPVAHSWDNNYICSIDSVASVLFDWSVNGTIAGKKCVRFFSNGEPRNWNGTYLCVPTMFRWPLNFGATGPLTGQACVSIREASDPNWSGSTNYLCTTINTPYGGQSVQQYQYAPPTVSKILPATGPTIGGISLTFIGTSFGQVGETQAQITISGNDCPLDLTQVYNHTYFVCTLPVGEGLSQWVYVYVNGQQSSLVYFNYFPPNITSIAPATGYTSPQTVFTIYGTNFGTSVGWAWINGYGCTIQAWTDTWIRALSPVTMNANLPVLVRTQWLANSNQNIKWSFLPPNITKLTPPNFSTVGATKLTLTGTSFGTSGNVIVGTSAVCTTVSWAHTSVVCTLPAGIGRSVPVVLTAGTQKSLPFNFFYDPPVITSITPRIAFSGQSIYLTIIGTSLGNFANGSVTINSLPCVSSATQYAGIRILCAIPDAVGWNVPVQVTALDQVSALWNFTYNPRWTSISTPGGKPTAGGVTVVLTGTSFWYDPAVMRVSMGSSTRYCPITSVNLTSIECTLPVGQGVDFAVYVQVYYQGYFSTSITPAYSNWAYFAYDIPVLDSITPVNGPTNGGYSVTLAGRNFGTAATVSIGLAPCAMQSQTHYQIICRVYQGSGKGNAVLVSVSGQVSKDLVSFDYNPPFISGISPGNAVIDAGITITLTGTDFASAGLVSVGFTDVTSTFVSSTVATFKLPTTTVPGTVSVIIRIDSQSSNAVLFLYDGPTLTSVSPRNGPTDAVSLVLTLIGKSFGNGAVVLVGGYPCPFYAYGIKTTTRYDCLMSPGQGTNLTFAMSIGTFVSPLNNLLFSFDPPKLLSNPNPGFGPTSGGTQIVLTGQSFGTSGSVTVGSQPCSTVGGVWSHTQILCNVAPGQGVGHVIRVETAGQSNELTNAALNRTYAYSAPIVVSVDGNPGPTTGGATVLIRGFNFYLSGAWAAIGGRVCTPTGFQLHTQFECVLPQGQGVQQQVLVNVSGQLGTGKFDYQPPTVTSIYPAQAASDGGTLITIFGKNFGLGTAHSLSLGTGNALPLTATINWNHTQAVFSLPAGTGANLQLTFVVADQIATWVMAVPDDTITDPTATFFVFSYSAPEITGVSGCIDDVFPVAAACPIAGNISITIHGNNFGTWANRAVASIGGLPCPITAIGHHQILCTLAPQPYGGYLLPVNITVSGQNIVQPWLSYQGPALNSGVLAQIDPWPTFYSPPGNLTLNDTIGLVTVSMTGKFLGNVESSVTIRYGFVTGLSDTATFLSKPFVCALVPGSLWSNTTSGFSRLQCVVQRGTGFGLVFQAQVGLQISQEGGDTLNYPQPIILPLSLRMNEAKNTKVATLTGANNQGDIVIFDVKFIGGAESESLLKVWYGPLGQPKIQECTNVYSQVYLGQPIIKCTTSPGYGAGFHFVVIANGYASNEGTDVYNYATPPIVKSVSGCSDSGNATINCPTKGGNLLIISGENFVEENLAVRIGTEACGAIKFISGEELRCTLPEGAGAPAAVVVIVGQRYSRSQDFVSYAAANVTYINGCQGAGISTVMCARQGGTTITLQGTNFGPITPVAIVVIGSSYCANVIMNSTTPHTKLTCELPQGTEPSQSVLLRQGSGVLSQSPVTVSYTPCVAGTYADVGVTNCEDCAAGSYTSQQAQAVCQPCESGFSAGARATVCLRCLAGSFSRLIPGSPVGAQNCTACSAGEFGNADQLSSCDTCRAGFFNNGTGHSSCTACPAGTYNTLPGSTSCSACSLGTSNPLSGSGRACDPCTAGTYAPVLGLSSCLDCQAGTYSPTDGLAVCTVCDPGSYTDNPRQARCKTCNPGFQQPSANSTTCLSCVAGYYQGEGGASYCKGCAVGFFAPATATVVCTECPLGTFNPLTNQSACSNCESGYYRDRLVENIQCKPCIPGYYAALPGTITCTSCPAGKFGPIYNMTVCTQCAVGSYQPTSAQTECIACPQGSALGAIGQAACLNCDDGKYTNITGETSCWACPVGVYSVQSLGVNVYGTRGATQCTACAIGTFTQTTGTTSCSGCDLGFYEDQTGKSTCERCQLGRYSDVAATTVCTNCTAGQYAESTGSFVCVSCLVGRYAPEDGASTCLSCEAGTYQPAAKSVECINCGAGTFSSASGAFLCRGCEPGNYAEDDGLTTCFSCGTGKYQNSGGKSACIECDAGFYNPSTGQAACLPCPAGTYGSQAGQSFCDLCDIGRWSDLTTSSLSVALGTVNCTFAVPGQFVPTQGARAPLSCSTGTYSDTTGATVCILCDAGTRQQVAGKTACDNCDIGMYQPAMGQPSCEKCEDGTIAPRVGMARCDICDIGYVAQRTTIDKDTYGATVCQACIPGTFSSVAGKAVCEICGIGLYTSIYASGNCSVCADGYFNGNPGAAECQKCPLGTQSLGCTKDGPTGGCSSCAPCQPGSAANVTGSILCSICPLGKYQSKTGSSSCVDCPAGQVGDAVGQDACSSCVVGEFSPAPALSVCSTCIAGQYQPYVQSTHCFECQVGTISDVLGASQCKKCLVGEVAERNASTVCSPCAIGKYSSVQGGSICYQCAAGSATEAAGSAFCTNCEVGNIAAIPGLAICTPCDPGSFGANVSGVICEFCEPGTVTDALGSSSCGPCPVGQIAPTQGLQVCSTCPRGTFQPFVGATGCANCSRGTASSAQGAAYCTRCAAGSYAAQQASYDCTPCAVGSYQSNAAASFCSLCPAGSIAADAGLTQCTKCPVGSFAPRAGLGVCTLCPMGQQQPAVGQSTCVNCTIGRFAPAVGTELCTECLVGSAIPHIGAPLCDNCDAGKHANRSGQAYCDLCEVGSYSSIGLENCPKCDGGTFGAVRGLAVCVNCPSGYFQATEGASFCEACDAGYYSVSADKPKVCKQCDDNKVAPNKGTALCALCPLGSQSDAFRAYCECSVGFASKQSNQGSDLKANLTCLPCPAGAKCVSIGVLWEQMEALEGWWKANQTFYRCLVKSHCPGGALPNGLAPCSSHRIGPLCAQLETGYIEEVGGGIRTCGSQTKSYASLVLIVIAILIAVIVQFVVLLRSGAHLLALDELVERRKEASEQGMMQDEFDSTEERELELQARRFGRTFTIHGPVAPRQDFTFKLKIALSFAQIISNLDIGLEIQWPSAFKSFLAALTPANIDFVQVTGVGCVVKATFYEKFQLVILMPPAVVVGLGIFFLLPGYIWYWKDTTGRKMMRRKFWKLLLFVLFLVYPYCSSTVLRTFVCKQIEGVSYLLADFQLVCYNDEWNKWAKVAAVMIVVYPLGIPAFFLIMLLRYRKRFEEVGVRAQLGFIYDAYQRSTWWWELADMLHKLLLTSVIAFLPFEWQLATAMIVVCVYATTMYLGKPYLRKSDDRLQLIALTEIILLLMSGNVLNKVPYDVAMDLVMSILLIAVVILFFTFFMFQGIMVVYRFIRTFLKERKEKREPGMFEEDLDDGHGVTMASAPLSGSGSSSSSGGGDTSPLAAGGSGPSDSSGGSYSHKRAQSTQHGRGQSTTHAQWVAEYKAGVDVMGPVERDGGRAVRPSDAATVITRNPMWNPTAGVEIGAGSGELSTTGAPSSISAPATATPGIAASIW